ncbi:hypothetical protein SPRG_06748 [Saprolegnia parasitica CBS 223.65]|uniref:Secreted protein n=1 Tax=Saprolegnia parasitica (strain CBS 223.65) TaxID=695850 RepID=A0A067CCK8_SAPPC|nr:hypothetical protein SPRG_06748 [Saprolegnia parasitica CBS 223.65]KDO28509.1 hypothetical protein SPRG_06748 [Saprolegnia parasitica CBS 223.65]|eukprot:XP_012200945.1 hypothetical protein SPRG_06748 [Saprolegnia parasitica CBS 223.65]
MLPPLLWTLLLLIVALAEARCFCPPICSFPPCGSSASGYERSSCNDLEAQSECNRANAMVTDMVNSAGINADNFLKGLLLRNATVSALQASYLRSKLSEAFEWGKPIGDCSDGLATNTHLASVNDICFSMPLFQQCDALAKSVPQYFSNIHNVLADRLLADGATSPVPGIVEQGKLTAVAAELVAAVKNRDTIQRESNKIRCQGYNSTVDIIRKSRSTVTTLSLVTATLAVMTTFNL